MHAQFDREDRESRRLDLGIERKDHLHAQNHFEIFWENFEGILDTRPDSGIDSLS